MSKSAIRPGEDAPKRPKNKLHIILDAATRVFASKGYHGSTIADVASEAGVATGTIYLYVRRKEELLVSLFQERLGPHLKLSEEAVNRRSPGVDQLEELITRHLEFYERMGELARVIQLHTHEPDPVIRDGVRPLMRRYFRDIEALLAAGVEAGSFAPDLNIRTARTALFGSLDATVTAWVLADQRYPLSSQRAALTTMLSRALGAIREPG